MLGAVEASAPRVPFDRVSRRRLITLEPLSDVDRAEQGVVFVRSSTSTAVATTAVRVTMVEVGVPQRRGAPLDDRSARLRTSSTVSSPVDCTSSSIGSAVLLSPALDAGLGDTGRIRKYVMSWGKRQGAADAWRARAGPARARVSSP